jgi:hypothetical protein
MFELIPIGTGLASVVMFSKVAYRRYMVSKRSVKLINCFCDIKCRTEPGVEYFRYVMRPGGRYGDKNETVYSTKMDNIKSIIYIDNGTGESSYHAVDYNIVKYAHQYKGNLYIATDLRLIKSKLSDDISIALVLGMVASWTWLLLMMIQY